MALLKAFMCQVVLFGLYKLFLEEIVEQHLVPDELTRNSLVGVVCLLCFGIQLYTEKLEEQARSRAEEAKAKNRRRTPPDTAASVSEFLDARTANMMRTLDAAMQQINQLPVSDGYVPNVIFAAAGSEHTSSKQQDAVVIEEIHATKLDDVIYASEKDDVKSRVSANEPIVVPLKVEEGKHDSEEEEEVEEEETETKSDVEEEDVVTVIDASKQKEEKKPVAVESEEEEEESEEEEEEEEEEEKVSSVADSKKTVKTEEKPVIKQTKVEEVEEESEEEEEEEEESEEEEVEVKKPTGKVTKTS